MRISTMVSGFVLFALMAVASQAQDVVLLDCPDGTCSLQARPTPVLSTVGAVARVATAPVRALAGCGCGCTSCGSSTTVTTKTYYTVRVRPARTFVKRLGCCR